MYTHTATLEHDDWNFQTYMEHVALWFFRFNYFLLLLGFFALHHRHLDLCIFLGTKYFQILGLAKHTHDLFAITFAFVNGCMFYDYAAARCVRTSCTQNLTDIRNQFSTLKFSLFIDWKLYSPLCSGISRRSISYSLSQSWALLNFHLIL